jgi:predicted nuclease of predicted toxin-antitoxin system
MARFLANENVPLEAIEAARQAGHDIESIREIASAASDDAVLALALADSRVLVTFDRDFGDLVIRRGRLASHGVILLRPALRSPGYLARFLLGVLSQPTNWAGHFAVAQEGRLRLTPLP